MDLNKAVKETEAIRRQAEREYKTERERYWRRMQEIGIELTCTQVVAMRKLSIKINNNLNKVKDLAGEKFPKLEQRIEKVNRNVLRVISQLEENSHGVSISENDLLGYVRDHDPESSDFVPGLKKLFRREAMPIDFRPLGEL